MDVMLQDIIGRVRAPDVTARLLRRAAAYRARLRWVWGGAVAAAAVLAITVTVLTAGGGARKTTDGDVARVEKIDDYAELTAARESRYAVEGEPHARRVVLDRGAVECAVSKGVGTFDVVTPAGSVHVVGTKFSVRSEDVIRAGRVVALMEVRVSEGVVEARPKGGPAARIPAGAMPWVFISEPSAAPIPSPAPATVPAVTAPGATAPKTTPATKPPAPVKDPAPATTFMPATTPAPATAATVPPPSVSVPAVFTPASNPGPAAPAVKPPAMPAVPATGKLVVHGVVLKLDDGTVVVLDDAGNQTILFTKQTLPANLHLLYGEGYTVTWEGKGMRMQSDRGDAKRK